MADPTAAEYYLLDLVNGTRAEHAGLLPLTFDPELNDAADNHTAWEDETDSYSHVDGNGHRGIDRITAAGYDSTLWGENIWLQPYPDASGLPIAASPYYLEKGHQEFVNSAEHYEDIIDPNYQHIGISVRVGDYQGQPALFVTEVFGRPSAAEAAENSMMPEKPPVDPAVDIGGTAGDGTGDFNPRREPDLIRSDSSLLVLEEEHDLR